MIPWKPPPPVPRKRLFQVVLGSQTSILMVESLIGVSVAVTRQKAGRPVSGGAPGGTNVPLSLSVTTLFGSKSADLGASKSASYAFTTRQVSVTQAAVEVEASATIDGEPVTVSLEEPYGARSCG